MVKKTSRVCLIVLLIFSLVGTSFALYQAGEKMNDKYDIKNSKTVNLIMDQLDIKGWSMDQRIVDSTIRVQGTYNKSQSHSTIDPYFYIRVRLRDFIGLSQYDYSLSDNYYLIDDKGNFVKGKTQSETFNKAKKIYSQIKLSKIVKVKAASDSNDVVAQGGYWYAEVNEDDESKYSRKKIVTEVEESPKELESNISSELISNQDLNQCDVESLPEDRCYKTLTFQNENNGEDYLKSLVQINLNQSVMRLSDWRSINFRPVHKWIIDDETGEGWIYWGIKFKGQDAENSSEPSFTANLVDSIELLKNPDGKLIYKLRATLDAVDYDDLISWEDCPQEILDTFINNTVDYTELENAIHLATQKLNKATRVQRYVPNSLENLTILKNQGLQMVEESIESDQDIVDALTKKILEGITNFRLNLNYDGELAVDTKIRDFGGMDWTVLYIDQNQNALIIADSFTKENLKNLGIKPSYYSGNGIYFNESQYNYSTGYDNSILKTVNDTYYDKMIKGKFEESFVQPVVLVNEPAISETANDSQIYERLDGASYVDSKAGNKEAFTLSISDWNKYYGKKIESKLFGFKKIWTKTPGSFDSNGYISSVLTIESE